MLLMIDNYDYFSYNLVQFHPESILTEYGKELLQNFLDGKV